MSDSRQPDTGQTSRRDFMKNSSAIAAGAAVAGGLGISRSAYAGGSDVITLGLIGCGGRGTGATHQAMNTKGATKLISMGDVFGDRLSASLRTLSSRHSDKVDVPADRQHVGLDAFERVLNDGPQLIILATPPGFRPQHFEAAVKAGRHVFMEKPVATDAPGVRRVLKANEEAKKQNLAVAVGLQRRHEELYKETIGKLQDGIIGDINLTRAYWNGGGVWVRPRQKGQTELEYQLRNWYYFNWICGDHIVEQHIHNLDVINWLKNAYPVTAQGQGGRQVRTGDDHGEIFDHHVVEFTYADGSKMFSQCRHIRRCWNSVSEHAHGSKGHADIGGGRIYDAQGELIFRSKGGRGGHQQEHHDLFADIRAGKRPNEGDYGALSTMTAIFGRMATYSGKMLKWDDALNQGRDLADIDAMSSFKDKPPVQPKEDGSYEIPMPGKTNVLS